MKHEAWVAKAGSLGVVVDEQGTQTLERYALLLRTRAVPLGMVSPADLDRIRDRHVFDALRAAPLVVGVDELADLGSGAGVPGIPLAVVTPDAHVTLVEHRRQRVAYLEMVRDELLLRNVDVQHARAANVSPASFDAVVARAFGDARTTWEAAAPLLREGGRLIYWAGQSWDPDHDAPPNASVHVVLTKALAKAGPLAIMTPQ